MPGSNCRPSVDEKKANDPSTAENQERIDYIQKENNELENAKAEMGEVREENERLKRTLQHMEKDYHSLQLRFLDILRQKVPKKPINSAAATATATTTTTMNRVDGDRIIEDPDQLLSLCLGRSPREPNKNEEINTTTSNFTNFTKLVQVGGDEHGDLKANNLTLGLGSNNNETILEETMVDQSEAWSPSSNRTPKTARNEDDETPHQGNAKRARVSVRARCDAPTMNDGCQWRKYGQKIAKGNPCPRAYYRCTVAPACPVRKQVQRCYEDRSILITTYEGTHNHPLPYTATSMASTTSAAASMLLSGSSTSHPGVGSSLAATLLNGSSDFGVFDNSRMNQLYLPKSSNPLLPTITLDLTASPSSSPTHLNRLPSFPSSVSFCSSDQPKFLPTTWGNGYQKYGSLPSDKTQGIGNQSHEHFHQAFPQVSLTESLTKAITSDPNFKSVIAVALSSMVGGGGGGGGGAHRNQGGEGGERLGHHFKWGEVSPHQFTSHDPLAPNGKGCGSSTFNTLSSLDSQK